MVRDDTPSSFTAIFRDSLRVELCRQGVSQAAAFASKCAQCVRLDGSGAHLALNGLGLGDREVIAAAEALIKLGTTAMLRIHGISRWALTLNQNSLTDNCVTHLSLLVSRCSPPLLYMDIRANSITAAAAQRIEEVRVQSSSPCVVKLDVTTAGGGRPSSEPVSACSLSSIQTQSASSCRGVDSMALEKRRHALLGSERPSSASGSVTPAASTDVCVVSDESCNELVSGSPMKRVSTGLPSGTSRGEKRGGSKQGRENQAKGSCTPPRLPPETCKAGGNKLQRQSSAGVRVGNGEKRAGSCEVRGTPARSVPKEKQHYRSSSVRDDEFRVDLTENLSPLLTSVMDLTDSVSTGKLRTLYDTDDIWSVVRAKSSQGPDSSPEDRGPRVATAPRAGASFRSVTVLCLSRNGLKSLEPLPPSLLRLDVSENELRKISGLEKCRMLTLLNARHNRICSMTGLENNLSLSHLFLGGNEIEFVGGIAHLILLETLDLSYNRLETQASIRPLSLTKGLQHLMLRGNPVMERIQNCFRPMLRNLCPSLQFIDGIRLTFAQGGGWSSQIENSKMWDSSEPVSAATGRGGASTSTHKGDGRSSQCGSYMHLLTRGVTIGGKTGYSDSLKMSRATRAMEMQRKSEEETKERQRRASTRKGVPLHNELLKKLAIDSKKYLEDVLAERLASVQQSYDGAVTNIGRSTSVSVDSPSMRSPEKGEELEDNEAEVTVYVMEEGNTTPRRADQPDGSACRTPVKVWAQRRGASVGPQSAGRGSHRGALEERDEEKCHHVGVRRDESLNHRQWVQLRGRMETRKCGSEPTSIARSKQEACTRTPERGRVSRGGGSYKLSPIRGHANDKQAISTIAKRFLSDMGRLTPEVDERNSIAGGRQQKVAPSLQKASVQGPRVFSPSSQRTPTKAILVGATTPKRRAVDSSTPKSEDTRHSRGSNQSHSILSPPPFYPSTNPAALQCKQACDEWVEQLHEDAEAVQQALQTVVVLIATQRQALTAQGCDRDLLHKSFLQERQQCAGIIKNSGMLLDTEVPLEVVEYYAFTPEELNCTRVDESNMPDACEAAGGRKVGGSGHNNDVEVKRRETLNCIRLIGDAKTCLRYIVLLIEEKKERSLYRYVDEVTEFMTCEWEKFEHIEAWRVRR